MSQRAQRLIEAARKPRSPRAPSPSASASSSPASPRTASRSWRSRVSTKSDYAALNGALDPRVRRRARLLPPPRAGGRAGGRRPPCPRHRRRPGRPQGRPRRARCSRLRSSSSRSSASDASGSPTASSTAQEVLLVCFVIALVTYAVQHLTRGTLSGNGRFGPYGIILGAEGIIRLAPVARRCTPPASTTPSRTASRSPIPPVLASHRVAPGPARPHAPGPERRGPSSRRTSRSCFSGSLLAQALSYAPPSAPASSPRPDEHDAAADFIFGFFLARIPILLFQAVQAALLPKLAALVGRGQARRLPLRAAQARPRRRRGRPARRASAAPPSARPSARSCSATSSTSTAATSRCCSAGARAFILALTLAQALIALLGHGRGH